MAWTIAAPYPAFGGIIVVPDTELQDRMRVGASVITHQAQDGTHYTYTMSPTGKKVYDWTFDLTRQKALQFLEFYRSYNGDKWQVTTHTGLVIVGHILLNPAEIEMVGRALYGDSAEKVSIGFSFEATQ